MTLFYWTQAAEATLGLERLPASSGDQATATQARDVTRGMIEAAPIA
jgi:hypothetical protein